MSKRAHLVMLSLALCLGIVACGGGAPAEEQVAPEQAPEEQAASEQAEVVQELDSDAILGIVEEACPIELSRATDIHVGANTNGTREVTFGSEYGDFSYTVDVQTGEILARTEPEMTEEQIADDPVDRAFSACFSSLENYDGGASDIKVKVNGTQIEVSFTWNGQSYDMVYDDTTGEVTQK